MVTVSVKSLKDITDVKSLKDITVSRPRHINS